MTASFTEYYDPGFLNVPGFGQSVTNPLSPVFYDSLGIVNDLSVYQSVYVTKSVNAGLSFNVGASSLSLSGFKVAVPTIFSKDVKLEKNIMVTGVTTTGKLVVAGKEYKPTRIKTDNGTFTVLATR